MKMRTDYNEALAKALILRAKRAGHEDEMSILVHEHRFDEAGAQERWLVTTWADGTLYGNWPWIKI